MNQIDESLSKFIKRSRWWLFGRSLSKQLLFAITASTGIVCLLQLAACIVPWYEVWYWSAGVWAAAIVATLLYRILHFPSAREAARELDATGLKERVGSALELLGDESFFAQLQKKDTWSRLENQKVHRLLPLQIDWKRPTLLAGLLILCLGLSYFPAPARETARELHALKLDKKQEIEKVEEMKEAAAEQSEEERAELEELLKDIQTELEAASSREELDKAVERAQLKLSREMEKKLVAQALKQLEAAGKLQNAIAEAREKDAKQLSEEEKQELSQAAKELEEAARQNLTESDQQALQQLAQAAAEGKLSQEALANAQATASAMASQAAKQLEQISNNQNGQANQTGQNNQSGQNNQNGQGNQNGQNSQGNQNGQNGQNGQGGQNGQNGQEGQNGQNCQEGQSGGNGQGDGNGGGMNYGSSHGNQKEEEYNGTMIAIPNEIGNDGNLTGNKTDGSSYSSQGGDALTWSGNQVQYDQVIGQYSEQAMSQIENTDYPPALKEIIRNYFSNIR